MAESRNGSARVFAERLLQFRTRKGWSRRELAARMGVTDAAVGYWERGDGFPTIGLRPVLCKVLGVTAKDLHLPPYNADD
ncbi:MAG TPA: helix-turn-helix transcriptional regulator [Ktedonobacterales bacterium]